jgi:hypothetical protein
MGEAIDRLASLDGWKYPFPKDDVGAPERNNEIAKAQIAKVILSRLIVLDAFLDAALELGGVTHAHKGLWTMLQVYPELLEPYESDVFLFIFNQLVGSFHVDTVQHFISSHIHAIREKIAGGVVYVLDEAQSTVTRYLGAFVSSISSPRPVLKPILQCLGGSCLIVSGTDISLGDLIPVLTSGVAKAPEYRLFHDTGSFDDRALHEAYMRQYLPATFLDTDSGKQLLTRTWRWLRGW